MKSILLFALCALCTSHSLSEATSIIEDEIVANNRIKTKLADLNLDCFHIISQHLNSSDLLSLSESSVDLSFVAPAIWKHRFGRKKVIIKLGYSGFNLTETEDEITFFETHALWLFRRNILRNFGHTFSNLKVHIVEAFNWRPSIMSTLFEQVNLYCSETLTDLHIIYNSYGLEIDTVRKPFKNVRNLTVSDQFNIFDHSKMSFSELFPALRNLTLNKSCAENQTWVNEHFPHLECLEVDAINEYTIPINSFEKLIENNPQIKNLNVDMHSADNGLELLQSIAEKLPNLEHLQILKCKERTPFNGSIHFEHLKTLIVHDAGYSLPRNITFGQLEELRTAYAYHHNSDRSISIVKNQKSLKKLTVQQYMYDSDILEIANAESNLEELIYQCRCKYFRYRFYVGYDEVPGCPCNTKVESIIELIQKSKHLKKLHLHSGWAATDSVLNELQNEFQNQLPEWTITRHYIKENREDHVYFERKEDPENI